MIAVKISDELPDGYEKRGGGHPARVWAKNAKHECAKKAFDSTVEPAR